MNENLCMTTLQDASKLLTDELVHYQELAGRSTPEDDFFPEIGQDEINFWRMRDLLLTRLDTLMDSDEDWQYFGQQAIPYLCMTSRSGPRCG